MDLCTIVRRDHDDLDRALRAMVEPTTPAQDLAPLLDGFRLGLAIHVVAECRVLATLITLVRPPGALRTELAQLRGEHVRQQETAERLAVLTPRTDDWYDCALELRVLVLDHAKREEYLRGSFDALIPSTIRRSLVAQYVSERMRLLATTSPLAVARTTLAA